MPPGRESAGGTWARSGRAGAFSFFSNKNLAVGEGGMVVTDDDEAAAQMRLLRSHGMTTLTWDRHRGHASGYDVVDARLQLPHRRAAGGAGPSPAGAPGRRQRAPRAARRSLPRPARGIDGLTPALRPTADAQLAHHLFTVVLDDGTERAHFREALAARGIQTSVHYPPAHRFSIYPWGGDLPVTEAYGARAVSLPLFATMTIVQQDAGGDCDPRRARDPACARGSQSLPSLNLPHSSRSS